MQNVVPRSKDPFDRANEDEDKISKSEPKDGPNPNFQLFQVG